MTLAWVVESRAAGTTSPNAMKRTSTCTICGQPAPRGAALCAPCRAALKRAGQRTVQDLPHYRHPVPRSRARRQDAPDGVGAESAAARGDGRGAGDAGRRIVLATAAIAALAGVAYLGQPQWSRDDADAPGDAKVRPTQQAPAAPPPAIAIAPPAVAAPVASAAPASPPPARTPARTSPAAPARAAEPPRVEPPTAAPVYPSLDAFGTIAEAPRVPPPQPVPAARPAPPPDRWQRMRDALAQCEREGGFSGFLCDQRTRIDACDGYWGRVPQCPDLPENPR